MDTTKQEIKDSTNQRIKVFARCRPLSPQEENSSCVVEVIHGDDAHQDAVKVRVEKAIKTFYFDKAFGPAASQIDVYGSVVAPLIQDIMMGYSCTVFVCGQTGSGKTFTMEGKQSNATCSWEEDPGAGMIPRAVHQLFEELAKLESVESSVHVSYLEIYNENLMDLLNNHDTKLQMFEGSSRKGIFIKNLQKIRVCAKEEVYSILKKGSAKRQKAKTELNSESSRSHTIFTVTVSMEDIHSDDTPKYGKIHLVDLAGSEAIDRSGAVQKAAQEAGNINQSLLTLGKVISEIVTKQPYISYSDLAL